MQEQEPSSPDAKTTQAHPSSGLGMAMRMSTELASGVFVGGGIGYILDYWLHTNPWMTLIFFVFGAAAGFRNMYRCSLPHQEQREVNPGDKPPQQRGKP